MGHRFKKLSYSSMQKTKAGLQSGKFSWLRRCFQSKLGVSLMPWLLRCTRIEFKENHSRNFNQWFPKVVKWLLLFFPNRKASDLINTLMLFLVKGYLLKILFHLRMHIVRLNYSIMSDGLVSISNTRVSTICSPFVETAL